MKLLIRGIAATLHLSALLIVVVSCTSTVPPVETPPQAATAAEQPRNSVSAEPVGSGSDTVGRSALMADLTPRNGQAVFMGVSGRLRDRDAEYDEAVLHVAEQASRYVRFYAEYRYITETAAGSIGYLDDINGRWDAEYADSLVDSVEVFREVQDNEGTYVLAVVDDIPAPPALPPVDTSIDQPPGWINSPPRVPGHSTVVGVTTPSRRFRDSLDRADQEALKEILLNTGTTVRMIEDLRDRDRLGTTMTVTSSQEASATLRNFYILARYISADGRYYYSLALAREE